MDQRQKLSLFDKIKSKFNFGGSAAYKAEISLKPVVKGSRSQDCRNQNKVMITEKSKMCEDLE